MGSARPHGQEAMAAITGMHTVQGKHPGSAASEPPQEVVQPVARHPDCFYVVWCMCPSLRSVIGAAQIPCTRQRGPVPRRTSRGQFTAIQA